MRQRSVAGLSLAEQASWTTNYMGLQRHKVAGSDRKLIDAAIRVMLGKPVPAK